MKKTLLSILLCSLAVTSVFAQVSSDNYTVIYGLQAQQQDKQQGFKPTVYDEAQLKMLADATGKSVDYFKFLYRMKDAKDVISASGAANVTAEEIAVYVGGPIDLLRQVFDYFGETAEDSVLAGKVLGYSDMIRNNSKFTAEEAKETLDICVDIYDVDEQFRDVLKEWWADAEAKNKEKNKNELSNGGYRIEGNKKVTINRATGVVKTEEIQNSGKGNINIVIIE
ncbi:hypothetical protein Dip518_000252 [Parelusimicrobium proximum]|uniref:hypothetical protein n=1 Tax=Parelusimicrobium proximum TaxID=3228953 RepID=UPI003D16D9CA